MDLKTRLQSHPVSVLKKEISKKAKEVNLRGYSAMKKADVITFMLKHSDKFNYIKHSGKGKKVEPPKNEPPTLTPSSTDDNITDDCLPNLSAKIKPT